MNKEEAIIRIKFLKKDSCNCPECEKNKEAYSVVLNYIEELEHEVKSLDMIHKYDIRMIDEVKEKSVRLYNQIYEVEQMLKIRTAYCNELEKDLFENCENYVISKETLRKLNENTDTGYDFAEEVLKLLQS